MRRFLTPSSLYVVFGGLPVAFAIGLPLSLPWWENLLIGYACGFWAAIIGPKLHA